MVYMHLVSFLNFSYSFGRVGFIWHDKKIVYRGNMKRVQSNSCCCSGLIVNFIALPSCVLWVQFSQGAIISVILKYLIWVKLFTLYISCTSVKSPEQLKLTPVRQLYLKTNCRNIFYTKREYFLWYLTWKI